MVPPAPTGAGSLASAADPPARCYLRLSVTEECNFRCRYCMPGSERDRAVSDRALRLEEIVRAVRCIDQARPLRRLRLTGGEPLLRHDLVGLVARLRRELPRVDLALTTNGSLLAGRAGALKAAGLDRLNISLDTVDPAMFRQTTGRKQLDAVLAGIEAARRAGLGPLKLNAVLQRTVNGESLPVLVRFAAARQCEIRFIELMRLGPARELVAEEYLPAGEALEILTRLWPAAKPLAGTKNASRWRFQTETGPVVVGLIAPVSSPFCGSCDRLRLDSRGRLFTCLRGEPALDLGALLRNPLGEDLAVRRIRRLLAGKQNAPRDWQTPNRMFSLGG